jgi:hypothetical protein
MAIFSKSRFSSSSSPASKRNPRERSPVGGVGQIAICCAQIRDDWLNLNSLANTANTFHLPYVFSSSQSESINRFRESFMASSERQILSDISNRYWF